MITRFFVIFLGTVAGSAVPSFDLVTFTDGLNRKLYTAHAILLEASKEVVADSGEPCAVYELSQRIFVSINSGYADIPSLAAAITGCSQADLNSVIAHVKRSISSESIGTLTQYRSLLELGRQTQQANLISMESLHAAEMRDIESQSALFIRFTGWVRNLRDEYAAVCALTRPFEKHVRPLTDRLVVLLLPLESMNSPTDELKMLQVRSRTREFISRLGDEHPATIGHALRRAYATMLDRNTDWKENALRAVTVAHRSLVAEHPYKRIVKEIEAVDHLIGQMNSIITSDL